MFFIIIAGLFLISFVWALFSLKDLRKNPKLIHGVKKELSSGRVVFHSAHKGHSSSEESSDETVVRE